MSSPTPAKPPKLTTTLPPPFLNLPTVPNLREVTSYPTSTPATTIRPGILYRSGDPSHITPHDLLTLNETHHIATIVDLRSLPEITRSGTLAAYTATLSTCPGVRRVWSPVFAAEDYSPEAVAARFGDYGDEAADGFVRAYGQILRHAGPAVGDVLRLLADGDGAVLVHCSAGKDRAGCVVAVVLSLLGVEDGVVAEEYALSERGLADLREGFVERLVKGGVFSGDEEGRKRAERMVGARAEAMRGTLEWLRREYGGVEGYVRDVVGVEDEVVEKVRRTMVVSAEGS